MYISMVERAPSINEENHLQLSSEEQLRPRTPTLPAATHYWKHHPAASNHKTQTPVVQDRQTRHTSSESDPLSVRDNIDTPLLLSMNPRFRSIQTAKFQDIQAFPYPTFSSLPLIPNGRRTRSAVALCLPPRGRHPRSERTHSGPGGSHLLAPSLRRNSRRPREFHDEVVEMNQLHGIVTRPQK